MNVVTNEFPLWIVILVCLIQFALITFVLYRSLKRTQAGEAIIRTGIGGLVIATGGALLVYPFLHQYERLQLGLRQVRLDTRTAKQYQSKEGHWYQAVIHLHISIPADKEKISQLLKKFTVDQLNDPGTLANLLLPPFGESLQSLIKERSIHELFHEAEALKVSLAEAMAGKLDGFADPQITIEYMGPVPDVLQAAAGQS